MPSQSELNLCKSDLPLSLIACYGVKPIPKLRKRAEWLCDRCKSDSFDACCLLCPMRGGALKRTTNKGWIHLICAAGHTEVYFKRYDTKSCADISKILKNNEEGKTDCCDEPKVRKNQDILLILH